MAAPDYEKQRTTFRYKTTNAGLDIHLDVQIPLEQSIQAKVKLPVLISIHGGGESSSALARQPAVYGRLTMCSVMSQDS